MKFLMETCVKVIAICGTKGSGKDAMADVFVRERGYQNVKFARPLKNALKVLFPRLSDADLDGSTKDVLHHHYGMTPRAIMQWFGTDIMQHEWAKFSGSDNRSFWSKRVLDEIPNSKNIVISDMRFQHELEDSRAKFGESLVTVRVERLIPDSGIQDSIDTHESESASKNLDVDLVVRNDGSLEDLERKCRMLFFGSAYVCRRRVKVTLLSIKHGRVYYATGTQMLSCNVDEWFRDFKLEN